MISRRNREAKIFSGPGPEKVCRPEQFMPETTSARACPICGTAQGNLFQTKGALRLFRCATCGMIFADDAGSEFADSSFYATTGSAFYASNEKLRGDYSPVRYEREIKLLRRFCRAGRVLDVGCSTGGFLYYLRERFPTTYEVVGSDVASGALDVAESKGVPVVRKNFLQLSAPPLYQAITFWAVLEHVLEPRSFLRKAHELLVPGEHCFVLVPNIRSLAVRLLGPKYRYILPQHLNYFSRATLTKLTTDCGFEIAYAGTMHFNPLVILQDWRSKTGFVPDQERAALLVKTNALKRHPLLSPARTLYNGVERFLARLGLADNAVIVGQKV